MPVLVCGDNQERLFIADERIAPSIGSAARIKLASYVVVEAVR
jgi:hypothetical protein